MGLYGHIPSKKASVVLPCFHHDREIGQLCRTFVDVESQQVVFDDLGSRLSGRNAIVLVDLDEYVKENAEYVPRTTTGVDDAELLRSSG